MEGLIVNESEKISIYLSGRENSAVRLATENLCVDLDRVCGARAKLATEEGDDVAKSGEVVKCGTAVDREAAAHGRHMEKIVIGTLGITELPNHPDVTDKKGTGIWEAFSLLVADGVLYIAGADRRGTIYGIYEFCEMIGVSPWHWFADVPVKKKECICLEEGFHKKDAPSVQYRGIFINDEEELEAWSQAYMKETTIGPKTYARVFELLLRLKANYIWPAMHVNAFNLDPENGRLANEMGIVVGTSHCDMLLRSNQNEWTPWCEKNDALDVSYDYSIEGRNREMIQRYWRGSVEQNLGYEVSYTVGMRGIHDSGFVAEKIDGRKDLSEEEKQQQKVVLLEKVITDQREILKEVTGNAHTFQTFVPYKEVLSLYDAGLNLPEDITLIWANDNFGYMRRYPNEKEQMRAGGHGLYYHASYWAHPGMSYLFFNSTPLAHMKNELRKSYENGIRKLWVLNAGAIKPLEQDITFFLCYAWEIGREEPTTGDVCAFTEGWMDPNFTGGHGKEAAAIYRDFAQITNVRKVEHMKANVFSQTAYGNEAARRMLRYEELFERTVKIHQSLPREERDAFLQMFALKIYAGYLINVSFYYADRSALMYNQGRMMDADTCMALSREADDRKRDLLYYYNKKMCGGKWDRILTPEEFRPPCTALYPACKPALVIPEEDVLRQEHGQQETECLEEDNRRAGCQTVDNPKAKSQGMDCLSTDSERTCGRYSENGYTEGEGCISILADHFTENEDWHKIDCLGRYEGSLMEAAEGALLEYEMHFISEGEFLLEFYRFPSLNSTGRIRLEVLLDGKSVGILESIATDEWRGSWKSNVMNNVEKLYLRLPYIASGRHMLRIRALDRYVSFSKIVIYTQGYTASNLGPEESYHAQYNREPGHGPYEFSFDASAVSELFQNLFDGVRAELPDVIYAGKTFWASNRLYLKNVVRRQTALGEKKYSCEADGTKNVFRKMHQGMFMENDGEIRIDCECALANSENAYLLPDAAGIAWEHVQSETDGRTGLAMHIAAEGLSWENIPQAPSLNYRMQAEGGNYQIWMLLKYDDEFSARVAIGIDGKVLPQEKMYGSGRLFNYGTKQNWVWMLLADAELAPGEHMLTVYAVASGIRVDRIFLTREESIPPIDVEWREDG
ncbi:MAG: glycosyl hydrolase 115 family protein [Lachnospiraceae bacterium]|nr:glycosyl hydrolase 115 family protein [Lachnospiraceae bacterium]